VTRAVDPVRGFLQLGASSSFLPPSGPVATKGQVGLKSLHRRATRASSFYRLSRRRFSFAKDRAPFVLFDARFSGVAPGLQG